MTWEPMGESSNWHARPQVPVLRRRSGPRRRQPPLHRRPPSPSRQHRPQPRHRNRNRSRRRPARLPRNRRPPHPRQHRKSGRRLPRNHPAGQHLRKSQHLQKRPQWPVPRPPPLRPNPEGLPRPSLPRQVVQYRRPPSDACSRRATGEYFPKGGCAFPSVQPAVVAMDGRYFPDSRRPRGQPEDD